MKISSFHLGTTSLLRDLRSGDLRLLILAVTLAVAALTAVGFFADRIKGGLQRDARAMLGGDLVVSADKALPQAFLDKARADRLQAAPNVSFPTMARAPDALGGGSKLVDRKSVV